jgi:CO/xanthine dehydrogenase Mo-binding subunit
MSTRPSTPGAVAMPASNLAPNPATSAPVAPCPSPSWPASLRAHPRLDQWLELVPPGQVRVRTGKVELGQGITTALAVIAAQALGVSVARVQVQAANTDHAPNEGLTAGSLSVQESGAALRMACDEARARLLQAAAARLGTAADQLAVDDGRIVAPGGASVSYWELPHAALLAAELDVASAPPAGPVAALPAVSERSAGSLGTPGLGGGGASVRRPDLAARLAGQPDYLHDLRWPGLLHGRMIRTTRPHARLSAEGLDDHLREAARRPGVVRVVRDGDFLGVVAGSEAEAIAAAAWLAARVRWDAPASGLPDPAALDDWLRAAPADTATHDGPPSALPVTATGATSAAGATSAEVATAAGTQTYRASYHRPFLAHASIGLSCAVARWDESAPADAHLRVWTHSQGIFHLRADLALMTGLPVDQVHVEHRPGAGCYGHNAADDVAGDAALLARACPGSPVRVQWSRVDELALGPLGAAMAVDVQAEVDASGRIIRWRQEIWSNGHSMRPGRGATPMLLAASERAGGQPLPVAVNMPLAGGGGAERNGVPLYDIDRWQLRCHRLLEQPVRTSSLRSLGAQANVFAIESLIDEIALARGLDPLAMRLAQLTDRRARAVLEQVVDLSGWTPDAAQGTGRALGLAFARYKNTGAYCAAVAEVEAEEEARVRRLWLAVDIGRVVHRDGALNQIEGGAVQTVSWVLREAVPFDRDGVRIEGWDDYPILRFSDVPAVEVRLMDSDAPSLGAGEATHGPVTAAIGNALSRALGLRVRRLPFTRDALAEALLAAE